MKGIVGIPYVTNPDLLRIAVDSIPSIWPMTFIVDNSGELDPREWPCTVCSQTVPLSHAQSMNYIFRRAVAECCQFACYMHSDARSVDDAHDRLLQAAEEILPQDPSVAILYTAYDALALYNLAAVRAVGGYDPNLPN